MRQDNLLNIRQLSTQYDCSLRTLRFYEQVGLLAPLRIDNQRLYDATDQVRLKLIIYGKRLGLSLQEIRVLILDKTETAGRGQGDLETAAFLLPPEKIGDQIVLLCERRTKVDEAIAELKQAQLRLPAAREAVSA